MNYLKNVLTKFFFRLQGNSLDRLNRLQNWQWLDRADMLSLQNDRLKALLGHAYEQVPYYRDIVSEYKLFDTSGLIHLERFKKIPLLTKAIIHEHFDDLKSNDLKNRNWVVRESGGSTGEPVKFIQDQDYGDWRQALKMLYDNWTGYKLADKRIQLWGAENDILGIKLNKKMKLRKWLLSSNTLNSFLMTPDKMREYVEKINVYQPVLLMAYAESLYDLACYIDENHLSVHAPRSIMTSAGILFPNMRQKIETVFKAPVFNRYGTREVGDIGCECNLHSGIHVSGLTHYIEILHPDGNPCRPGESGEIVVTLLTNYAMPLIRYQLGDVGSWSDKLCKCGRNMPLLENIQGRVSGSFLKKDGTRINGVYFTPLIMSHSWIKIFRVIQIDYDHIIIQMIPHRNIAHPEKELQESKEKMVKDIQLVMGDRCRIHFQFVAQIYPTISGKNIYTVSKLTQKSLFESLISDTPVNMKE